LEGVDVEAAVEPGFALGDTGVGGGLNFPLGEMDLGADGQLQTGEEQ